jgi:hypothetical protein
MVCPARPIVARVVVLGAGRTGATPVIITPAWAVARDVSGSGVAASRSVSGGSGELNFIRASVERGTAERLTRAGATAGALDLEPSAVENPGAGTTSAGNAHDWPTPQPDATAAGRVDVSMGHHATMPATAETPATIATAPALRSLSVINWPLRCSSLRTARRPWLSPGTWAAPRVWLPSGPHARARPTRCRRHAPSRRASIRTRLPPRPGAPGRLSETR